jgi:3-hydroxybutyryl-CoA dehydratase
LSTAAVSADREFLEDYAVGEIFLSPARTITESDVMTFAGLTGDWHPLHTDAVYAGNSMFGQRIVHGMLTLAVGSTLVLRLGPYVYIPKGFIAFYGVENVRFVRPVFFGDTIHSVNRVEGLVVKDDARGIIQYSGEVVNQREETVLVWTSRMLVSRRPAGSR